MFMYESTLTRRPLYSVSPHFRRMITGSLILNYVAEGELEWFARLVAWVYVCVCVCGGGYRNGRFGMGQRLREKWCVGRRERDSRTVLEALDGD